MAFPGEITDSARHEITLSSLIIVCFAAPGSVQIGI
jgi:hypothetical protein